MSFFNEKLDALFVNQANSVTFIIALILFFLLIISLYPGVRRRLKEKKTNKRIQRLGSQYLKQVILPDGIGGSIFLDYIILAQDSIILVILKKFRGTIFCADNIDYWTQLINNKSYKFPNTLQQLDSDILSVKNLVKNTKVTGLVVFSSDCQFPKGKPAQVKSIEEIQSLEVDKQLHSEILLNAWYKIKDLSNNHSSTQSFAENYFKDETSTFNYMLPITLFISIAIWLVWRLNFAS